MLTTQNQNIIYPLRTPDIDQALYITNLIFENTPYAFCLFDESLAIHFWSQELQKITGVEATDVKGLQVDSFLPFLKDEKCKILDCLNGNSGITSAVAYSVPNSSIRGKFQLHYIPLKMTHSCPPKGIILFKDITAELEMKNLLVESEDRFKNMADAAPVLLWLTKEDGACIYFNQSWLDFTGRSLEQEKGFGWFHGIHPEDIERCIHHIISDHGRKKSFQIEYRLRDRNGEYRWMMSRGMPRYNVDNEYAGFTGSCVDITDHKLLVDELKAAKEAADNASLIKTQFLANVSHEIRTPLGIILGFADILRNEEISKVERLDLLDRILKSGNQLLHIIDDVLDVSKVEANRFELEVIDFSLRDFIKEINELFDFRAREKGLIFRTLMSPELPDFVKSDPTRIRQVLTNVIGNAIKFTKKGEVELIISSFVQSEKVYLGFTVIDSGIGIGAESCHRLFKPFCQIDSSTTRKYGGTGLGLHLSRKLAHMLGGDLKLVTSQKLKGSTFYFQLPIEVSQEKDRNLSLPACDDIQENFHNLKGKSILVVDDAEENRILLEKYLTPFETVLDFAQNGAEAVEMTHQKKFDLILMDIQMPVLDGFGALEKIRSFDLHTPIVALTAHALKTERDKCLSLGFYEHMAKPINRQKLVSTLSILISQNSQKKSLILSKS